MVNLGEILRASTQEKVIKRKAFLIASPLEMGMKGFLSGVVPDIENMRSHLMSLHGGAWESEEIKVFHNPKLSDLKQSLESGYDFVVVQYSGHGFEYTQNGTQLHINKSEIISLEEIHKLLSPTKGYYFIDCCRGVEEPIKKSMEAIAMEKLSESVSDTERMEYRKKYNNIIQRCERGISILYSCSMDESADEDPNSRGGIFSYSYFQSAKKAISGSRKLPCSILEIFDDAEIFMANNYRTATQTPVMKPERRLNYFPFII